MSFAAARIPDLVAFAAFLETQCLRLAGIYTLKMMMGFSFTARGIHKGVFEKMPPKAAESHQSQTNKNTKKKKKTPSPKTIHLKQKIGPFLMKNLSKTKTYQDHPLWGPQTTDRSLDRLSRFGHRWAPSAVAVPASWDLKVFLRECSMPKEKHTLHPSKNVQAKILAWNKQPATN